MDMNLKQRIKEYKEKHGVYFVAEIGQNHQGSLTIAKQMVDSLVGTGVACIKTAKRDIDTCLTEEQKNMPYINANSFGETYYEHRKHLEFSKDEFKQLKNYIEEKGFDFTSSFTDANSLDFLIEIGVPFLKIASQRLTDWKLMVRAAKYNLPTIISTGMSISTDIEKVLGVFKNNEKYLLQCTSSYPCAEKDLNLNVIGTYKELYDVDGYGFSGHHSGIAPDLAAYMMGIDILERHYTLNKSWKGTDQAASLSKKGIEYIFKYIQQIKESLGSSKKELLESELSAMKKLRGDLK